MCRLNTLYMIARAGSGHIGSSFSSLDIISWLYLNEMTLRRKRGDNGDIFFSSKGHDAPGLYSLLIGLGELDFELIHSLRRKNGLPGHPDIRTPNMITNTGSLGMGISKAKGMIFANRMNGVSGRAFVMTGDGELQEGQIWESLVSAANDKTSELHVIVDHNKLQSDKLLTQTSDLGDLESKFASFGWHVSRVDGHDFRSFSTALEKARDITDQPKVFIADTIKGKGISFMEHTAMESDAEMYRFHSGAPGGSDYTRGAQELLDTINEQLDSLGANGIEVLTYEQPAAISSSTNTQKLIPAYSNALLKQAEQNSKIVALDADLILDTGLMPFKDRFPDRFIECGIAEMDMVSQAGGLALNGALPICHSFSCFLSTRPNEQIYNNATEKTKVVYVGSLSGVLPGGPGHSHQSVRDISALGGVPGLVMIEPCNEIEVEMAVDYCVNKNQDSSFLRLVSIPCEIPFELPADYSLNEGQGVSLTNGTDAAIISYGPVMLSQAVIAAKLLETEGISLKVINLPWLNRIDGDWLLHELGPINHVITLDNHYISGGQGERVLAQLAIASTDRKLSCHQLGIEDVPSFGTNDEVLESHGLNAKTIAARIKDILS
ncbi:transketolase [Thalassospira sp. ER-Se-21-Dark]|nr:transketolase [Thalassospira sp. ER-Se-21-Dark]